MCAGAGQAEQDLGPSSLDTRLLGKHAGKAAMAGGYLQSNIGSKAREREHDSLSRGGRHLEAALC